MAELSLIPVSLLHLLAQRTSKLFLVGREAVILAAPQSRHQEKICLCEITSAMRECETAKRLCATRTSHS
jgi:hypothetical protein